MNQNNSMGNSFGGFNMPRARVSHATNNLHRDIPDDELTNRGSVRRLCNGSLARNEETSGFDNVDNGCMHGAGCTHGETCGGSCTRWGLHDHPVAMVYSPCQPWNNVYKPEIALERGTVFKDLDLPFEAAGRKGGC